MVNPAQPALAYLAGGKIKLRPNSDTTRVVESKFGETLRDRALKAQQRHAWKSNGAQGSFLSGPALWGGRAAESGAIPIAITSICRGTVAGQLLYSLETDSSCCILSLEEFGKEERRIWNDHKKTVTRLNINASGDIVGSVEHQLGTANIGVKLAEEGSGFSEVTEGDSLDTAPRWVIGRKNEIVFQSAGVGRNQHGHISALAPFSVQHVNIQTGEMIVLAEDRDYDFLTPAMLEDGTLYFIRRPYQAIPKVSLFSVIKDIILFPFRLLYSIFQFLNFFSMLFTGKKLNRAGNVPQKEMDIKQMMIWGKLVQMKKNQNREEEAPDLVPKSWELVRRSESGTEEVLARGVLDFDITAQGEIIYTNGSAVFLLRKGAQSEKIHSDKMVSQVAFVSATAQQGL